MERCSTKTQSGSSLIEVMVSLFVLAIGLLGVLAMQTRSAQYNQSAYSYSQAVYLANDLAERISANMEGALDYAAAMPDSEPTACQEQPGMPCSTADMIEHDLWRWSQNVKSRLPDGEGSVRAFVGADGRDYVEIRVTFDDSRTQIDRSEAEQSYSLTMGSME